MMKFMTKITKTEAKEHYCKGRAVYITNEKRTFWELPPIYTYGSHAPAEELFYRSIPECEGETKFFISI